MAFNCYGILLGLLLIENVPNVFLAALKKNKWPSVVSTIQGLIGLALTYFFLPIYGITGAIISLITAFLFTSGWFNFVFMRQQLKQHLK
jgi:O-antigen/teichoic acid export membrane protein